MDILVIIYLSFKIYDKAATNQESPWQWVIKLLSLFITTELIVALITLNFWGLDKLIYTAIIALFFASLSAYLVFQQLNREIADKQWDIEENIIEEDKEEKNLDHFR